MRGGSLAALHIAGVGETGKWVWGSGRMMWGSEVPEAVEESATAGKGRGGECRGKGAGVDEYLHDEWGF